MARGSVFSFRLDAVELGKNRHDESITTCTVSPAPEPAERGSCPKRLGKNSQIAADILRRTLGHSAQPLPQGSEYPPDTIGVTAEQWRQAFYVGFPGENGDTKRRAFNRARDDLLSSRVIGSLNDFVWFVRRSDE